MLYFDFVNPYITYMLVVLAFTYSVWALFNKRDFISKHKNKIIIIAMILLLWTQFARYAGVFYDEDVSWNIGMFNFEIIAWSWGTHLPFYICRLSAVILLYYTITRDKKVESFLFYWGATGLAGIIYPNGEIINIYNLTETFYIDHFLLAITPFFLVAYQGYRPSRKDLFIITGVMFVILTMFIPLNQWITALIDIEGYQVDYFYLSNQSIVAVWFGKQPTMVFILIHTFVAYMFFRGYYLLFREKKYELKI